MTAVTPVAVQRGSGAARMQGKRTLAPTSKRAQSSLDTKFPAFASAVANLTVQGTVDGALCSSHYTAAMSMVFTHGLEMPETC